MAKVTLVGGAGYVGLTYAVALAVWGHEVVGLDRDAAKICSLSEGQPPIYEPDLEALLRQGLASGRLRFTTDEAAAISDADFVFICVGTPPDSTGHADMAAVVAATQSLAKHARGHTIVVTKSTMPVGSVQYLAQVLAEHAAADATFAIVANPEFLREGAAIADVFAPARIVLGTEDPVAAEAVAALYASVETEFVITDPRSAEMIKYASNAFLANKISFVNELALICERLDADIKSVTHGMGLDPRIGSQFLRAGAGFGGSCFPKDVRALAAMACDAGLDPAMLKSVLAINTLMREHIVAKLDAHLQGLAGKTIGILGLAFKPETDDIRESPALDIIGRLQERGALVRATDPAALEHVAELFPALTLCAGPYAAAMGADAVVLMTEWDRYRTLDWDRVANAMRGNLLFDARNALAAASVVAAGLCYDGVGTVNPPLVSSVEVTPAPLQAKAAGAPIGER